MKSETTGILKQLRTQEFDSGMGTMSRCEVWYTRGCDSAWVLLHMGSLKARLIGEREATPEATRKVRGMERSRPQSLVLFVELLFANSRDKVSQSGLLARTCSALR